MAIVQAPRNHYWTGVWPDGGPFLSLARQIRAGQGELPLTGGLYQEGAVQNGTAIRRKSHKFKRLVWGTFPERPQGNWDLAGLVIILT
jgi:hypothetical protein